MNTEERGWNWSWYIVVVLAAVLLYVGISHAAHLVAAAPYLILPAASLLMPLFMRGHHHGGYAHAGDEAGRDHRPDGGARRTPTRPPLASGCWWSSTRKE